MDEASQGVRRHDTQEPKDKKNYCNGDNHVYILLSCILLGTIKIDDVEQALLRYTKGMDTEAKDKLNNLEIKINAIYASVEKTRKYFLWTMIITIVLVALPAIGLVFALPNFLQNYVGTLDSLSQY